MPAKTNDEHIDELYSRTNKNQMENALIAQRIELHERACIEKHEQVLQSMMENKTEVKWVKRLMVTTLISVLITLTTVLARGHGG